MIVFIVISFWIVPVGYIILIVAVVLLVSALVGFAIYKYSHKDHHLTERINRV